MSIYHIHSLGHILTYTSFGLNTWVATKDVEVVAKVRTASMMARKSRGDIWMDSMGGAEVLGPVESEGTRGTGGAEDAGDVGSGTMTGGVVDARIWGSSDGTVGGG